MYLLFHGPGVGCLGYALMGRSTCRQAWTLMGARTRRAAPPRRGGDDEALAALVRAYHDQMPQFSACGCAGRVRADDAVQEAF